MCLVHTLNINYQSINQSINQSKVRLFMNFCMKQFVNFVCRFVKVVMMNGPQRFCYD